MRILVVYFLKILRFFEFYLISFNRVRYVEDFKFNYVVIGYYNLFNFFFIKL